MLKNGFNAKNISAEDRILFSRVEDIINYTNNNYGVKYLGFLNEREKAISEAYINYMHTQNYSYFGGYTNSIRNMLGIWSEHATPDNKDFSISSLTFKYRKEKKLTHRDFLGSLLSLQIKRDAVGDILVDKGMTVVFLHSHIAPLVLSELKTVGSEGVLIKTKLPKQLPAAFLLNEENHIVTSHRLDCYVATITNKSRKIASQLIKTNQVYLNHLVCDDVSKYITQGDVLSIRGYGKFILKEAVSKTKNGRHKVLIDKYI